MTSEIYEQTLTPKIIAKDWPQILSCITSSCTDSQSIFAEYQKKEYY